MGIAHRNRPASEGASAVVLVLELVLVPLVPLVGSRSLTSASLVPPVSPADGCPSASSAAPSLSHSR